MLRRMVRRFMRSGLRRRAARALVRPAVGSVDFGDLDRLRPISDDWGFERGTPIDRFYIEEFLALRAGDIAGDVLEIGEPMYTARFGGDRVRRLEVLHIHEGYPGVTIVGDLTRPQDFEPAQFDCIVLTQTLNIIYDTHPVVHSVHKLLKPGGVVLATFPGISKLSRADADFWGYNWAFTSMSASRMFGDVFGPENVELESVGNVKAATAFLYGLAAEELTFAELAYRHRDFEVLLRVRATRSASA